MDSPPMNVCACKGIRTCILCEQTKVEPKDASQIHSMEAIYYYCPVLKKAVRDPCTQNCEHHVQTDSFVFDGIRLFKEFVDSSEEALLVETLNKGIWVESQSGRRKQDYGPKVNFKRQKVNCICFTGLPLYSQPLVDRMNRLVGLEDFCPVELCCLEYQRERGAAIDPHFDDFWLWGERLITVNLQADSWLRMTPGENTSNPLPLMSQIGEATGVVVRVPLARRSLLVLEGPARHMWKHAIGREDIHGTRLALTLRELSPPFLPGGRWASVGEELLTRARTFAGISVAEYNASGKLPSATPSGH